MRTIWGSFVFEVGTFHLELREITRWIPRSPFGSADPNPNLGNRPRQQPTRAIVAARIAHVK